MCVVTEASKAAQDTSIDVSRAYVYAKSIRSVFMQIPAEDCRPGDEDMVGKLNLSLCGTRDAAQNWAKAYSDFLASIGFERGRSNPCIFMQPSRNPQLLEADLPFPLCL